MSFFQLGALSDMISAGGGGGRNGPRVRVDGGVQISSTPPDDEDPMDQLEATDPRAQGHFG